MHVADGLVDEVWLACVLASEAETEDRNDISELARLLAYEFKATWSPNESGNVASVGTTQTVSVAAISAVPVALTTHSTRVAHELTQESPSQVTSHAVAVILDVQVILSLSSCCSDPSGWQPEPIQVPPPPQPPPRHPQIPIQGTSGGSRQYSPNRSKGSNTSGIDSSALKPCFPHPKWQSGSGYPVVTWIAGGLPGGGLIIFVVPVEVSKPGANVYVKIGAPE